MSKKLWIYVCVMMLLVMNGGCARQEKEEISAFKRVTYQEIKEEAGLKARASNELGVAYMKKAYLENPEVNQLFSPISLSFALAMLQNGGEGETREGILQALGVEEKGINENYQNLLGYFSNLSKGLLFGNSLWLREGIKAEKDFTDTLSTYYHAELFTEDFAKEDTIGKMNSWISKQTNGMIKDAVKEIDSMVIALLMNTVYFKGSWVEEFSETATRPENFTPEHKEAYFVDMMQMTSERNYYEDDEIQAVKLKYLEGFSMTVILPKGDLGSYVGQMDEQGLSTLLENNLGFEKRVDLRLPKTDYEIKNDLNMFLKERGMELAFDKEQADFSRLATIEGQNVFVSRVYQNARIIIDEKGTEAAAVTVIETETTSAMEPEQPVEMVCNHPYLYVIQEDLTKTILFIGYVVAP